MFNTKDWNYDGVRFIEFYGLRRSGNHAILAWLIKNLSTTDSELENLIAPTPELGFISKRCGDAYHLNDIGTGWSVSNPKYLAGLIDGYVSAGAKTIVLSYEDYGPDVSLLHTFPNEFHFLKDSKKIVLVRDIVNVLASRYKASTGPIGKLVAFDVNVNKINAWITGAISQEFKIKYEDWLISKEYRDSICEHLNITNRDLTDHVSSAGGGSSFSGMLKVNKDKLLNRSKEVDLPEDWNFYLKTVEVIRARKTAGYIKHKEDAKVIKVIGDSHTSIFDGYTGDEYFFDQTRVHGATARGSANPKTKTNSLELFREGLKDKKADKVIVGLGEVDCGYIIWWQNKFKQKSLEDALNESMDGLFKFVKEEVESIYKADEIVIMAVIPPVIEDNTNSKFLEGRRAEVNPSIDERLALTNLWNTKLAKRCKDLGYHCINMNSELLDENRRVKKEYRNPDQWNHHLWESSTIQVALNKLKDIGI
jgi:hypothetical protein